jgi:hypothetical protein
MLDHPILHVLFPIKAPFLAWIARAASSCDPISTNANPSWTLIWTIRPQPSKWVNKETKEEKKEEKKEKKKQTFQRLSNLPVCRSHTHSSNIKRHIAGISLSRNVSHIVAISPANI